MGNYLFNTPTSNLFCASSSSICKLLPFLQFTFKHFYFLFQFLRVLALHFQKVLRYALDMISAQIITNGIILKNKIM